MAGAVLVREGCGISMNGSNFVFIIDTIRPFLAERSPEVLRKAYQLYEEGMDAVSVKELTGGEFHQFCQAVSDAFAEYLRRDPHPALTGTWRELLTALDSDPRRCTG
jgi:hypothetical protein